MLRLSAVLITLFVAGCFTAGPSVDGDTSADPADSGYVFDDEPAPSDDAALVADTSADTNLTPAESSALAAPLKDREPSQTADSLTPSRPDPNAEARARCTRRGGDFTRTTAGLFVCVQRTRDANSSCTKPSDCEGACLARSRTCAPVTPLIGCYDQITQRGGVAKVCVD